MSQFFCTWKIYLRVSCFACLLGCRLQFVAIELEPFWTSVTARFYPVCRSLWYSATSFGYPVADDLGSRVSSHAGKVVLVTMGTENPCISAF